MKIFHEDMITEFDGWLINGINVGEAIRKQIVPEELPYDEEDNGMDKGGRPIIIKKYYCPDCGEISYVGQYCYKCGRRLRK